MVASTSFSEQSSIFTLRNIALGAGGIILFAGVAAGGGRLLQLGGAKLLATPAWSHVGRAAALAGDKLLYVGKGAFLSVAVPIYTVTWALPKWIITVGIPKGAAFYYERIFVPYLNGISKGAQAVVHFIKQPLANAANWAWSSVLSPALVEVAKATQWIFQSILVPASLHVWKSAVLPAAEIIGKSAASVKTLLETSASHGYQSVLLPTFSVVAEGASGAASAVQEATSWFFQNARIN
jgi:hypothetical protein